MFLIRTVRIDPSHLSINDTLVTNGRGLGTLWDGRIRRRHRATTCDSPWEIQPCAWVHARSLPCGISWAAGHGSTWECPQSRAPTGPCGMSMAMVTILYSMRLKYINIKIYIYVIYKYIKRYIYIYMNIYSNVYSEPLTCTYKLVPKGHSTPNSLALRLLLILNPKTLYWGYINSQWTNIVLLNS